MKETKVIREFGCIRRTSDHPEDHRDRFTDVFLTDKAFDNLRDFVAENEEEGIEVERSFSYHRSKGRDFIKVRNYVGVIETVDGTSIEILPKIYYSRSEDRMKDEITETRKIFLHMLKCLRNSPFINIAEAHLKASRFPILEVFISAYLDELEKVVKRGIRRKYVPVERNQRFLKGKLLFNAHLRHNIIHKERFFVNYDEFLSDIPQNRLIRSSLDKVIHHSKSIKNQNRIRHMRFVFDDIPCSTNLEKDLELSVNSDRLFSYYDRLLGWARVFLLDQSFTNFKGKHLNQAILFPMERIFEDYVASGFRRYLSGYSISTQDRKYHLVDLHATNPKFRIKPDIVLRSADERLVLDTKWKMIDETAAKRNYNISQSDMYQLYAYGKKYSKHDIHPTLYLIYPKHEQFQNALELFQYEDDLHLFVIPFDLTNSLESEIEGLVDKGAVGKELRPELLN